ncbi:hypothetical protein IMG5_112520 [Ichthyophthirius multifiliis]|uniref:Ion transport domain-containing protein n=1 Tax=Ichthyophthirius multifiliis TaxID=5932 RepID=G0QTW6_ICHMU|nr:hypothetical protein IMG5_112520 [Ichthyophthirius multifiliis]EGR31325.1 hypothetical protein IMG5_112520 [Ichthyophthirius multifiliis]|eukprot:XP_004034811.1 hypothetical protein IMG5_112520 [Ichthyophthirius multifiliis]
MTDQYPFLEERKFIILICKICSYICFKIIKHKLFDNLILLIIIFNSITLCLDDPTQPTSDPIMLTIEEFFLWAYFAECVLKITAMGFIFNKKSYLRDGWNILDFTIVTSSVIPVFIGGDSSVNLSSLRSLRVLRPLRTISSIKSLKLILITLFSALPYLINTLIILIFFFLVFAIGGLQLFMGLLKKKCFEQSTGIPYIDNTGNYIICGGETQCKSGYICGKTLSNPNHGVTNFDNILTAFLMVFQCVTLEGWTQIMYWLFDSFTIFIVIYFVCIVWFGSFFYLIQLQQLLRLSLVKIKIIKR